VCGIAGILNLNSSIVTIADLKKMTDVIVHRGPDGEGHWVGENKNIGFGHRRLSIIDLSEASRQPFHYANKRYTITFNGEIYNYLELRQELQAKGYSFRTTGDTEILMALYNEHREDMLPMLDGMFALAIWDEDRQELFCARDRFGEKPFHYFKSDEKFVFGSEMKELWAYGISKIVNHDKLNEFVNTGAPRARDKQTETCYDNIQILDAATSLTVRDGKFIFKKYWSLDHVQINNDISLNEASKKFYELLRKSVELRLRSDVTVGSSLSGGLDSSAIVMLVDQLKSEEQGQKTFSARFKGFKKDEGKYIEEVVKKCKNIEAFNTWPAENSIEDIIEKATWHQEEPFGSSSILAQWSVMKLARENNVTVLLDGQGADEYLAGYLPEYKTYIYQLFYQDKKRYKKEFVAFKEKHGAVYPIEPYENLESSRMKLGRWKANLTGKNIPHDTLFNELKNYTTKFGLKELLRYADRNSMAHSVEVRLPFLSHHLVEFVFSLPDHFKVKEGWTKLILRKSMEDLLPQSITWRVDKIGYEPPQKSWMENDKIKEIISEQRSKFNIENEVNESYVKSTDWRLLMSHYIQN
jgi:asparagine synthase (glutamine-hydrolysing)